MKLFKFKKGHSEYFYGLVVSEYGFTFFPFSEEQQSTPYGKYFTFEEKSFYFLWFCLYKQIGHLNWKRQIREIK